MIPSLGPVITLNSSNKSLHHSDFLISSLLNGNDYLMCSALRPQSKLGCVDGTRLRVPTRKSGQTATR
ncbi:hypothetical protein CDL15_Pgr012620 [Punica granatum]|uniref:Uncharacterized protein n=1 Tax=Punica granatum TaxID=22663 RepID=A0A218XY94_PUNGR|nr:hypothetical protein CDL15_Pgr012620 [Punica granatum]